SVLVDERERLAATRERLGRGGERVGEEAEHQTSSCNMPADHPGARALCPARHLVARPSSPPAGQWLPGANCVMRPATPEQPCAHSSSPPSPSPPAAPLPSPPSSPSPLRWRPSPNPQRPSPPF